MWSWLALVGHFKKMYKILSFQCMIVETKGVKGGAGGCTFKNVTLAPWFMYPWCRIGWCTYLWCMYPWFIHMMHISMIHVSMIGGDPERDRRGGEGLLQGDSRSKLYGCSWHTFEMECLLINCQWLSILINLCRNAVALSRLQPSWQGDANLKWNY